MKPHFDFNPVSMSYTGALRGVQPRRPGESFAYAVANCEDPDWLICLAASNPEGYFYGLVADAAVQTEGAKQAQIRQIDNVTFIAASAETILAQTEKGVSPIPPLHYLCCDERRTALPQAERTALFALAAKLLLPGGLFGYAYRAYEKDNGHLQFLVRELAPEMDAAQAGEFLEEVKKLGGFYFKAHPEAAARLDRALAEKIPDRFFADYNEGPARSGSFDTIVALRPRGFAYVGDADIATNYIELSAPVAAHQLVIDCRGNHLYEPIKDFVLDRKERCDIWCRRPLPMTADPAVLFGDFVYGITKPLADVPKQLQTEGKPVDLDTPLFSRLIDLMTLMPLGVGDFLAHAEGRNFSPSEITGAIQVLVACGIARPMRGRYRSETRADSAQPRLVGSFNKYLDRTVVNGANVWMASPMAGNAIAVSARDALVMQALNRAGLIGSVGALLPELERIARDPAVAARVMDTAVPTSEVACDMIKNSVSQSIVQWYAYGLLAAA